MSRLVRTLSAVVLLCAATFAAWAAAPPQAPAPDSLQAIAERTLIRELMDRYGIVHDSGTPEQYADLFTADGEIATGTGSAIVKGRQALMDQARRDHERYSETGPDGKTTSIMRHLISNAEITLTGPDTATGTCYVTTMVKKGAVGPAVLSISRYVDRYVKAGGKWRIQRREIYLGVRQRRVGEGDGFRQVKQGLRGHGKEFLAKTRRRKEGSPSGLLCAFAYPLFYYCAISSMRFPGVSVLPASPGKSAA